MTVYYTGNTGGSTGPHLDFRVYNPATGAYEDPSKYTSFLTVGDNRDPVQLPSYKWSRNARASQDWSIQDARRD